MHDKRRFEWRETHHAGGRVDVVGRLGDGGSVTVLVN